MSKVVEEELARLQQELQDEQEWALLQEDTIQKFEKLKQDAVLRLEKSQNEAYRMGRQIEYLQNFLNYEKKKD